jgi:hypothetical protein
VGLEKGIEGLLFCPFKFIVFLVGRIVESDMTTKSSKWTRGKSAIGARVAMPLLFIA